ncbi:DMT family transporter [Sphingobacterium psychroaquaticum]|uniref:Threonine/homoserine efflux transporter RhtA n=1 Tax=Sphingobacterium psychroaquaticum TaxID=561061 RepID=A0A1X7I1Z7_9SPHI|nr:DMT family transporter [Sphingobacterium psychroaquaticum]QBQ42027.1 EamA family transporter [Sphingobacterium psychroaquaticum]SMG07952.1 Threonine/homoserine efflux transporter RhtA [Sphingobacterium psychroaquaticum]
MKKSYLLLHLAVLLAGFTGVFGKLITLNEGLLTWYRMLFAAIILFVLTRIFKVNTKIPFAQRMDIIKVGMLIAIHWVFFYGSIKAANISIGVVCYCLTSFFTAIFKPMIDKTKINPMELLLSGLTIAGISLIFHFDSSYQLGIMLGVVSSALAALYTVFNARLVKRYNSLLINYYQMAGGMIGIGLLLPVYLYFFPSDTLVPTGSDTLYLFLLALFCTAGLYVIFAEVLKRIPTFTVSLTFNLEPVYAIAMAFLFFKEGQEVNASFYIGLGLIMMSVVLQSIFSMRESKLAA